MHDWRHVSWRQSDIPVTGEAEYGEADHEGNLFGPSFLSVWSARHTSGIGSFSC